MRFDFEDEGEDQEYLEFFCPMDKEFTKFATTIDDPEIVVCTKCPYRMKKSEGVNRNNQPEYPQIENHQTFLERLKEQNSSN